MKYLAAVVVSCITVLSAAWAQQAGFPSDANGAGQWVSDYYVNNDVAHVPDFLNWLQSNDALTANKSAEYPASAFLAAVFSANPERIRGWVSGVSFTGNAKDCIERALWLAHQDDVISEVLHDQPDFVSQAPPSMLTIPLTDPDAFDMMWGTFFATGDVRYPARLIEVLAPSFSFGSNQTMGTVLRGTAAWSLSSNMRHHERILGLVREEAAKREGTVHDVLTKMLDGYNAENKPWPNQMGEFRAMLTLVSEENLKEFEKPSDEGVSLTALSSAKPGDHIAVKLTFAGMDLSSDLGANVTYDFKIIAPDGSLYGGVSQTGLTALIGRVPTRFFVFDNNPTPIAVFAPHSSPGKYKFNAVIKDNIGHHTLSLSQEIALTK